MTTNKPTKVCGLSDIEATITLARAGDKEAAQKILSLGPGYDALIRRAHDDRAALVTALFKSVPALLKSLFRMRTAERTVCAEASRPSS